MNQILPRICGTEMEYGFMPGPKTGFNSRLYQSLPDGLFNVGEYLSNGSRLYVDMGHKLEYATPESSGVVDAAYSEFSGEQIVLHAVTQLTKSGRLAPFPLRKSVTDDNGETWGYHENYLMKRSTFDERRHFPFLFGHCATRSVLTGAGHLFFDGDSHRVWPSQKMQGITELTGEGSTSHKSLVNTRDRPLTALKDRFARQHMVSGDPNITARMTILKLGAMSAVIRLGETRLGDYRQVMPLDPLESARAVGYDSTATALIELDSGKTVTALDIQETLLEQCESMSEKIQLPSDEVLALSIWRETLELMRHNRDRAKTVVEWLSKLELADKILEAKPGAEKSEKIREICKITNAWDHVDPTKNIGRRWMGKQNPDLLDENLVEHYVQNPVPDTRAQLRAGFIRDHSKRCGHQSFSANWDYACVGPNQIYLPKARVR